MRIVKIVQQVGGRKAIEALEYLKGKFDTSDMILMMANWECDLLHGVLFCDPRCSKKTTLLKVNNAKKLQLMQTKLLVQKSKIQIVYSFFPKNQIHT